MRILITGGNGSIGRELVPPLLSRGHEVAVLDREVGALAPLAGPRLTLVEGKVQDRDLVVRAVRGVDAVIHLAWSFSDAPLTLVEVDLRGHQILLDACRAERVGRFLHGSSAVVYGRPRRLPIDEDHPLDVLEARKPAYAIAKEAAEKLTLLAARSGGPRATIFRWWWAFGEEIPGRHLRDMLSAAAAGRRLAVPAECGGSFLAMEDLVRAVEAALAAPPPAGEVLNLASAYVGWDEVARMAALAIGSRGAVDVVPRASFTGAAFLAEAWHLDARRAQDRLGVAPLDAGRVRDRLARAIRATWQHMKRTSGDGGNL